MKRITYFLASLLCLHVNDLAAQNPTKVPTFVSPVAASLGTNATVPVSLHAGTPDISFPLYQLKSGPLSVPLSISYNASGVKPDEHPGWVGMGWSLNAGGMITRIIKGIPDETAQFQNVALTNGQTINNLNYLPGYAFNTNLLNSADWNSVSKVTSLAGNADPTFNWNETEPDEFVFNFNGYAGTFYVTPQGVRVKCDRDILINIEISDQFPYYDPNAPLNPNNLNSFSYYTPNFIGNIGGFARLRDVKITGFEAITEDGTRYYFGYFGRPFDATYEDVEFSVDLFSQLFLNERWDTWYLKKIVSADKAHNIEFTYEHQDPIASFGYSGGVEKASGSARPGGLLGIFGPVSAYNFSFTEGFNGRLIRTTYLKKISTPDIDINFNISASTQLNYNYAAIVNSLMMQASNAFNPTLVGIPGRLPILGSTADINKPNVFVAQAANSSGYMVLNELLDFNSLKWAKLDNITVVDKTDNSTFKKFSFKYNNVAAERLQLLSFNETGKNNTSLPAYKFTYNNPQLLPPYNSLKTDHWGYYNNVLAQIDPNDQATWAAYKAKREPVTAQLLTGMLTNYTTPLGGSTTFTYEPNTYNRIVTRNVSNGAFSLASVAAANGAGVRVKTIVIKDPAANSTITKTYTYEPGILGADIQYYFLNFQDKLANGNVYTSSRFVTESILPLSSSGTGAPIGYSKVTETMTGQGRTEYVFTNHDSNIDLNFDATISPNQSPYSAFNSRKLERGLLSLRSAYNEAGTLLQKDTFMYAANNGREGEYVPAVATRRSLVLGGIVVSGTAYRNYIYPYTIRTKVSTYYDQNGANPFVETTNNVYENTKHNFMTRQIVTSNNGESRMTDFRYPLDYTITGTPTNPASLAIKNMQQQHVFSPLIETFSKRYFANGIFVRTISADLVTYHPDNYQPENTYKLETVPVNNFVATTISETAVNKDSRYVSQMSLKYDAKGNIIATTRKGDDRSGYVWGYNSRYPIAIGVNAADTDVAYTSFEDAQYGNWTGTIPAAGLIADAYTGKKALNLQTVSAGLSKSINPSREYFVTYRTKNATAITISNQLGQAVKGNAINGWTSFTHRVKGSTVTLTSAASALIDELALFPTDGSIRTYTYDPIIGATSQTDEKGMTIFYEYDDLGRLKHIRDEYKNIIKSMEYNYGILKMVKLTGQSPYMQGTMTFTNKETGAVYTSVIKPDMGEIPEGIYDVATTSPNSTPLNSFNFYMGCKSQPGAALLSNISITEGCGQIVILPL